MKLLQYVLLCGIILQIHPNIVVMAKTTPRVESQGSIKNVLYDKNKVYALYICTGFHSYIEFEEGENIERVSLGQKQGFIVDIYQNKIFIQPSDLAMNTNMTVITNKRTYAFNLIVGKQNTSEATYILRFSYPIKPQLAGWR